MWGKTPYHHYLTSSSNTPKNTNMLALLKKKPIHYIKIQNKKVQREKDEKIFNTYDKKIKHMQ